MSIANYAQSFEALQSSLSCFLTNLISSKSLPKKLSRKCQIVNYLTSRVLPSSCEGIAPLEKYAKTLAFSNNHEAEKQFMIENSLDILDIHGKSNDSSVIYLSNSGTATTMTNFSADSSTLPGLYLFNNPSNSNTSIQKKSDTLNPNSLLSLFPHKDLTVKAPQNNTIPSSTTINL